MSHVTHIIKEKEDINLRVVVHGKCLREGCWEGCRENGGGEVM